MELFFIVLRNIAIFIIALYLLFVIISAVFVISFSSILSHHDHDLFVVLTNKKDNLDHLANLLSKSGVKTNKSKMEELNNFSIESIEHQNGEAAKKSRELLTSLADYLLMTGRENDKVASSEDFLLIESNLNELESVYRQRVVLYNADVLGYNFWISFIPTRIIYKILKRKPKDIIN